MPSITGPSFMVCGTLAMVLSVYFDAWWHETIGRESFWIPPHLGIYAGLFTSLGGFLMLAQHYRWKLHNGLWLYLGGVVSVIVAGYADELWHQAFGVERIGTIEAIWSPTHVAALLGGAVASLGIITYLLSVLKAPNLPDSRLGWLLAAQFGVFVSLVTLLLLPIGPETPFRLIGVWGAPILSFVILSLRFLGSGLSRKPWALTLITGFSWAGNAILLSNHGSTLTVLQLLAVGMVPPVLADIILQNGYRAKRVKRAYATSGLVWGLIFGLFFYPLTNSLSYSGTSYTLDSTSLLIVGATSLLASLTAGVLAGIKSEQWLHSKTVLLPQAKIGVGAAA